MKRLFFILSLILLLPGCAKDTAGVKNAVLKYNQLLAEGYRNLNMNPLAQVSTNEIAVKAYYHMAAIGEARIKMDAKMDRIEFLSINTAGLFNRDKMEVTTEEAWTCRYISLDSGESTAENSLTYQTKYILEKRSGKWLVADITIEKVEEKKSSEDLLDRLFKRKKSRQSEGGK